MLISTNWTFFSQLKIILIPDQEFLPSVVDYIKQSLELRKWGLHWSMYNFNYEYMTFLYVVHVYMFCNVVLYCITRKGFICNKDYYDIKHRILATFNISKKNQFWQPVFKLKEGYCKQYFYGVNVNVLVCSAGRVKTNNTKWVFVVSLHSTQH